MAEEPDLCDDRLYVNAHRNCEKNRLEELRAKSQFAVAVVERFVGIEHASLDSWRAVFAAGAPTFVGEGDFKISLSTMTGGDVRRVAAEAFRRLAEDFPVGVSFVGAVIKGGVIELEFYLWQRQ